MNIGLSTKLIGGFGAVFVLAKIIGLTGLSGFNSVVRQKELIYFT